MPARPSRRATLVLLGGGAALAAFTLSPDASGAEIISPPQARALMDKGALLIDIRRPDEWALTGVARDATLIDMRDKAFVDRVLAAAGGDKSRPIALICARGVRSRRVSARLEAAGFTAIRDVGEGMLGSSKGPGYIARGLPLSPYRP